MDTPTLDLFGSAPAAPSADPTYARMLEDVLSESGRRNAWKAMAPDLRDELALAIAVVARAKRTAYDSAHAGRQLANFDWMNLNPALAAAVAKLSSSVVDCDSIPMAAA